LKIQRRNSTKFYWISNPRAFLNCHSKSISNPKTFLWRKLFLCSNPSTPYFTSNCWSKGSPPLDQINSNSFEYFWIICKGYYSFGPAQGHQPTLADHGWSPLPPLLPRTVPPDPRPPLLTGRISRPTVRRLCHVPSSMCHARATNSPSLSSTRRCESDPHSLSYPGKRHRCPPAAPFARRVIFFQRKQPRHLPHDSPSPFAHYRTARAPPHIGIAPKHCCLPCS
jgi:hypothetical protein